MEDLTPNFVSPLTTQGDLLFMNATPAPDRLPIGSAHSALSSDGTDVSWASISGLLDSIGSTRGQILYRGASGWAALSPGTSGDVLTSQGPGADPHYATGGGGGVTSVTGTANQVIASASTGAVTLSLPQDISTTSNPTFGTLGLTALKVFNVTGANAEWLDCSWGSNICTMQPTKTGSGTLRSLVIRAQGAGGSFSSPAYSFADATNYGMIYNQNDSAVAFIAGGQQMLELISSGVIGTFNNGLQIAAAGYIQRYKSVNTAGLGVPGIYGATEITAQSTDATIASYANGAADADFEVSATLNVAAASAISTSISITYTDKGNTSRTLVLPIQQAGGTGGSYLVNGLVIATGDYTTPTQLIRVKASTTVTVLTSSGTFTGVTYSASALIKQVR